MGKGRGRGEGIRIRRRRQVKERKAVNEKFSTRGPAAASRRFLGRVGGGLEFIDVEAIDSRNVSRARTTTTTTNSKMIDRNNIVGRRTKRGGGAQRINDG